MTKPQEIVSHLRQLLTDDAELRQLAEQSLAQAAAANPHVRTNPVRTLDDWFAYMERFLYRMPWQTMDIGGDASFFRRIDQNIGYFYFLIDQPLEALKDRGYWYPSLQYEPRIAAWLVEYNKAWGEWLSSPESWNDSYYHLARTDARFELDTDRYESPDNWHCWNDFFARKLNDKWLHKCENGKCQNGKLISPSDGVIMDFPIKTMSANSPQALLGDSPHANRFEDGEAIHLVLDVFDYHRFHAPCDGRVVECRIIPGIHAGGGIIIWDEAEGRYRYDQCGATGFQSLETRGVLVLDTPDFGYVALIAVGIQQISSVQWTFTNDKSQITNHKLTQGTELGKFLFGGSDVVLFFEPGRAPKIAPKNVKVGDCLSENR